MRRVVPLLLGVLAATPASAMLLEDTPERVVFMGFPTAARDLTVKMVRRKASYGIYAFRTGEVSGRMLRRDSFAGLVEGCMQGVGLDPRGARLLETWLRSQARTPKPIMIGPYHRYYFDDGEWLLSFTTRTLYEPTSIHRYPLNIISQMYARKADAGRLEALSRQLDPDLLQLRDGTGLRRLTP